MIGLNETALMMQTSKVAQVLLRFPRQRRLVTDIFRVVATPRGGDREKQLRIMDSKYIILLETKNPFGLNEEEDLFVHIG